VTERLSVGDVRAFQDESEKTVKSLDAILEQGDIEGVTGDLAVVARAAHLALAASAAGLGECREKTPYASLYPLIDQNGQFKWCCTHEPSHCSS
jgi:DNA-binding phage protein